MIQWMLAIWSLVPLPFLNPAWTCGSSRFMYCWSLAQRILSITLLACEMSATERQFEHSLALPFFGIEMKTDLFQSCGHCWVFQMFWHIECSTLIASSFRIWNSSTGIPSPYVTSIQKCTYDHTIALISHASKVMLKILQVWLQQYVNCELPDFQAGSRKGRGTRDQIANIHWIREKAREFQKNIYFCFIDYAKAFDYVDHNKLWKIQEMEIPASWEVCMQVKKQHLEPDMEEQTGSKLGKEYVRLYIQPAYWTYMQSTSCKMPGWMKHKLESRLSGEISITSDIQMTPPFRQKAKRT